MTQDGRTIKPPLEELTIGRVFRPVDAFLFKKILKVSILLVSIWATIAILFFSHPILTFILTELAEPTMLIVNMGLALFTQYYVVISIIIIAVGSVYIYVYFKWIEYSVVGWSGEVMPEIYTKKGIINITKRHVPFRTITHIKMRRGPFDRLLGIGTLVIETAGKSNSPQEGGGFIALIIQRLIGSDSSEEHIEGIRFYEELRDFVLRELRGFGRVPISIKQLDRSRSRIFTPKTLLAFQEVRDALSARQRKR